MTYPRSGTCTEPRLDPCLLTASVPSAPPVAHSSPAVSVPPCALLESPGPTQNLGTLFFLLFIFLSE